MYVVRCIVYCSFVLKAVINNTAERAQSCKALRLELLLEGFDTEILRLLVTITIFYTEPPKNTNKNKSTDCNIYNDKRGFHLFHKVSCADSLEWRTTHTLQCSLWLCGIGSPHTNTSPWWPLISALCSQFRSPSCINKQMGYKMFNKGKMLFLNIKY